MIITNNTGKNITLINGIVIPKYGRVTIENYSNQLLEQVTNLSGNGMVSFCYI